MVILSNHLGKEIPAQSLFLLVSNIKTFIDVVAKEDLQGSIMNLVLKCYECKVPKLQVELINY